MYYQIFRSFSCTNTPLTVISRALNLLPSRKTNQYIMLRQSSFYEAKFETPSLAVLENEIDGYRLLQKRAEPLKS